jgi:hypothetical protein
MFDRYDGLYFGEGALPGGGGGGLCKMDGGRGLVSIAGATVSSLTTFGDNSFKLKLAAGL